MPSTRRRFLVLSGLALAGSVAGESLASSDEADGPSADEWPMGRYDPAGTGHNPAASGPKDDVEVAWSHESTDWFLGTQQPIRRGNTIYATGNGLLALDSDTGQRQFGRPGPYQSSPARVPTSIYRTDTLAATAPSGIFGLNAGGGIDVPLLDHSLGSERWAGPEVPGPGFFGPNEAVTPVTADGTVFTPVPGTNSLVALDPTDGTVRWRSTHHEGEAIGDTFNRPVVRDDIVVVTNWPHQATAFDAKTGEQRWQRELDEQLILAPVATDAGIVVPSRNRVWLLDAADGSTVWERDLGGNATESAPAVGDGTIFVADEQESLHALNLATGEVLWSTPFDGPTTPVVADGYVYAVRSSFSLEAFDAETGEKQFVYEPSQVPLSPPVVGDGVLYVTNRKRVVALEEGG